MLTIQEHFSWFSEEGKLLDLTLVGEAALIESIQVLTLAPSNFFTTFLCCVMPKIPPSTAMDSGTPISVVIHDLVSGVNTFDFVILNFLTSKSSMQ